MNKSTLKYLIHMRKIDPTGAGVRIERISESADVSSASVSKAIRPLFSENYIYRGTKRGEKTLIFLTKESKELADGYIKVTALLLEMLRNKANVPSEIAQRDAVEVACELSPETIMGIMKAVDQDPTMLSRFIG